MVRRVSVVALLTALIAMLVTPIASATPRFRHYVALGDSFTAGPGILDQGLGPPGCLRSTNNYPSVLADKLGLRRDKSFTDASCSGAETTNMLNPQPLGPNPPQLDALRANTDLVTVSIGGNDVGYTEVMLTCLALGLLNPFGAPCKEEYGTELDDRIADIAPKVANVLTGIKRRSPSATVVVVGYLRILPPSHGCWPLSRGDVPFLDGAQQQLNTMLEAQAAAQGAIFVNPYTLGHDMCAPLGNKWVEGLFPTSSAYPVHPNVNGMLAVGNQLLDVLGGV